MFSMMPSVLCAQLANSNCCSLAAVASARASSSAHRTLSFPPPPTPHTRAVCDQTTQAAAALVLVGHFCSTLVGVSSSSIERFTWSPYGKKLEKWLCARHRASPSTCLSCCCCCCCSSSGAHQLLASSFTRLPASWPLASLTRCACRERQSGRPSFRLARLRACRARQRRQPASSRD